MNADPKKATGPNCAVGVELSSFPGGDILFGHAPGEPSSMVIWMAATEFVQDFANLDAGQGGYSVPAPVISAALFARFRSRDGGAFADKLLSALRYEFGGHDEKGAPALVA